MGFEWFDRMAVSSAKVLIVVLGDWGMSLCKVYIFSLLNSWYKLFYSQELVENECSSTVEEQ